MTPFDGSDLGYYIFRNNSDGGLYNGASWWSGHIGSGMQELIIINCIIFFVGFALGFAVREIISKVFYDKWDDGNDSDEEIIPKVVPIGT